MLKRITIQDPAFERPLVFASPDRMFVANTVDEVVPVLKAAEAMLESGVGYLAGFISFDAAPAFDSSFVAQRNEDFPLVCLGYFHDESGATLSDILDDRPADPVDWQLDTQADEYTEAIERIHAEIERGNTYQINYTVRYRADAAPQPARLFAGLGRNARYGAHVQLESQDIVSASPELFFALRGDDITCKPMKGTAMRGLSRRDDLERRDALRRSEKDRAENVMITDMVRNDLGRVAQPGTVIASELCAVEQHPTVWQMTSTVEAKTAAGFTELFTALFPSASVTGAPKSASLKLIRELEQSPRGVYTGAIGYFSADRRAQFNVAIRTATFDSASNSAEYGVGSGIIWDSVAADEFRECQLKAEILQRRHHAPPFSLLETMRWTAEHGIAYLERHLDRLAGSAAYFGRPFDRNRVVKALQTATHNHDAKACRVRMLLSDGGDVRIELSVLPETPTPFRLRLAARPIDQHDPFLYHKTTHRDVYTRATEGRADCDDVLLWNADGFITETTIANVFVRHGNGLRTPPVDCGLLAGVMRGEMLDEAGVHEGRIHRDSLKVGDQLVLSNALRGRFHAVLIEE